MTLVGGGPNPGNVLPNQLNLFQPGGMSAALSLAVADTLETELLPSSTVAAQTNTLAQPQTVDISSQEFFLPEGATDFNVNVVNETGVFELSDSPSGPSSIGSSNTSAPPIFDGLETESPFPSTLDFAQQNELLRQWGAADSSMGIAHSNLSNAYLVNKSSAPAAFINPGEVFIGYPAAPVDPTDISTYFGTSLPTNIVTAAAMESGHFSSSIDFDELSGSTSFIHPATTESNPSSHDNSFVNGQTNGVYTDTVLTQTLELYPVVTNTIVPGGVQSASFTANANFVAQDNTVFPGGPSVCSIEPTTRMPAGMVAQPLTGPVSLHLQTLCFRFSHHRLTSALFKQTVGHSPVLETSQQQPNDFTYNLRCQTHQAIVNPASTGIVSSTENSPIATMSVNTDPSHPAPAEPFVPVTVEVSFSQPSKKEPKKARQPARKPARKAKAPRTGNNATTPEVPTPALANTPPPEVGSADESNAPEDDSDDLPGTPMKSMRHIMFPDLSDGVVRETWNPTVCLACKGLRTDLKEPEKWITCTHPSPRFHPLKQRFHAECVWFQGGAIRGKLSLYFLFKILLS